MKSIKQNINSYVPTVIEKIGYYANPILLNFVNESTRLIVFYFHGFYGSVKEKSLSHVDPQNNFTISEFEEFVQYFLDLNYVFIKPDDLRTGVKKGISYAIITFDDGYFNNTLAVEVLKKYEIPAVIFITTKNILENESYWWDVVYKYRTKEGVAIETIKKEQASLKKFNYSFIDNYIKKNFGYNCISPWSDIDRPLNQTELKSISECPLVTIGNHTHNHAILVNYNECEIRREFDFSNKIIFDLTGFTPTTTAFPNGNYNDLVLKVAEESGFHFAFTTVQRKTPLPLKVENFSCLDRFMVKVGDIKHNGPFYRVGYDPISLYSKIKEKVLL